MLEPGQKSDRVAKLFHVKAGRVHQTAKRPEHRNIVVKKPDGIVAGSAQRQSFLLQFFQGKKTGIWLIGLFDKRDFLASDFVR